MTDEYGEFVSKNWPKDCNFQPWEFLRSNIAESFHIDNMITNNDIWHNIINLVTYVLQPARNRLNQPLYISSGYRCRELNSKVGGAKNSYHIFGRAADLYCSDLSKLEKVLKEVNASNLKSHKPILKEFIVHQTYIHIAL